MPNLSTSSSTPWCRRRPTRASSCNVAATCTARWPPRSSRSSLTASRIYSPATLPQHKAEDWEKAQEYLFKAADGLRQARRRQRSHSPLRSGYGSLRSRFSARSWSRCNVREWNARWARPLRGAESISVPMSTSAVPWPRWGIPFPVTPGAARRALVAQMVRQLGHVLLFRGGRAAPRGPRGHPCRRGALLDLLQPRLDGRRGGG